MSQRNFQNDRYKEDNKPKGVTRRSASAAKPKSAAGSSVYVKPPKTKQQKKKERKEREKQQYAKEDQMTRTLYAESEKTPRYKQLRRLWWVLLVVAIVAVAVSFLGKDYLPQGVDIVFLVISYAAIIGALYLDLGVIRKERKKFTQEITGANGRSKEARKLQKQLKAEAKAKEAERAQREAEAKAKAEEKAANKKGLFGRSKAQAAADGAAESQQAAKK